MKVHTSTPKIGIIETDLLRSEIKKVPRSRRDKSQDAGATSWHGHLLALEKRSAVLHGLQAAQRSSESRAARVEELQAQVEARTYKVDSTAIAESMLQNQTHFLEEDCD
jgi:anti-sigma28 factor (negative regulator of flagellin synthesis)